MIFFHENISVIFEFIIEIDIILKIFLDFAQLLNQLFMHCICTLTLHHIAIRNERLLPSIKWLFNRLLSIIMLLYFYSAFIANTSFTVLSPMILFDLNDIIRVWIYIIDLHNLFSSNSDSYDPSSNWKMDFFELICPIIYWEFNLVQFFLYLVEKE